MISSPSARDMAILLQRGARLGRYVIRQPIGQGGMGAVYRAVDSTLPGRQVAIKVLSSLEAADIERFKREARAIAMVSAASRHIVKIHETDAEGGRPYIVMELLHGEDLASLLTRSRPLEVSRAVDVMLGVCSGTWSCHRRGILHRDIKPKNIFLHVEDEGEVVKILDFGVSIYPFATDVTGPQQVVGTTRYMAPEQLAGRGSDDRSDIYSIGVVLYECLTGHRLHEGQNEESRLRRILNGEHQRASVHRHDLPVELDAIVERAIHVDPGMRFDSARALGEGLIPFASSTYQSLFAEAFQSGGRPAAGLLEGASESVASTVRYEAVPTRVVVAPGESPAMGTSNGKAWASLAGGTRVVATAVPPKPRAARGLTVLLVGAAVLGSAAFVWQFARRAHQQTAEARRAEADPPERHPSDAAPSRLDLSSEPPTTMPAADSTADEPAASAPPKQSHRPSRRSRGGKPTPKVEFTPEGSPIIPP
jgi:hypothetical protein